MNGKKHGYGEYTWNNGSNYAGEWKDNVFEGFGEYKWVNGRTYIGPWKNNQMSGLGEMTF